MMGFDLADLAKKGRTKEKPLIKEVFNDNTDEEIFKRREPQIKQIQEATGLNVKDIIELERKKRDELKGLISEEGAFSVVGKDLGVDIKTESSIKMSSPGVKKEFKMKTKELLDDVPTRDAEEIVEKAMKMKKGQMKIVKKEKKEKKSTRAIKQKESNIPNVIAILWGYDGTSKSEQIMKFKPEPLIIDLENKLEPLAKKLNFPVENIIVASQYNEKYEILGGDTLQSIRDMLANIRKRIREKGDVSAIGMDGISDVRPYAVQEWLEDNPGRKQPANAGDWRDINDKVRDIVFMLINIGRVEKISIFLTAQVGGEYVNNVRVKDVPDCKTWITHNVDHKFKMMRNDDTKTFEAFCEKSYYDPFFTIDLTDWSHEEVPSLLNMLQDPNLLKEYIEKSKETIRVEEKKSLQMK